MPLEKLRVRDVMTDAVMFLQARHSLAEAWDAFHRHSVNGAPVLGEHGRLVGIVTTSDLADPRRRSESEETRVGDVMTKVVYAVRATDPLLDAALLMLNQQIHHAVVVNEDGTIAGMVSPMDVLRAVIYAEDPRNPRVAPEPRWVDVRDLP